VQIIRLTELGDQVPIRYIRPPIHCFSNIFNSFVVYSFCNLLYFWKEPEKTCYIQLFNFLCEFPYFECFMYDLFHFINTIMNTSGSWYLSRQVQKLVTMQKKNKSAHIDYNVSIRHSLTNQRLSEHWLSAHGVGPNMGGRPFRSEFSEKEQVKNNFLFGSSIICLMAIVGIEEGATGKCSCRPSLEPIRHWHEYVQRGWFRWMNFRSVRNRASPVTHPPTPITPSVEECKTSTPW
jgi:hypothetical protein